MNFLYALVHKGAVMGQRILRALRLARGTEASLLSCNHDTYDEACLSCLKEMNDYLYNEEQQALVENAMQAKTAFSESTFKERERFVYRRLREFFNQRPRPWRMR